MIAEYFVPHHSWLPLYTFFILDTTVYKELSVDSWVTGRKPFATSLPNTVMLLAQSVT